MKSFMVISTLCIALILGGCTNRQEGTAGGAVAGGIAGNLLTGGSGVGTVVGAAVGGVAGNQLSK